MVAHDLAALPARPGQEASVPAVALDPVAAVAAQDNIAAARGAMDTDTARTPTALAHARGSPSARLVPLRFRRK